MACRLGYTYVIVFTFCFEVERRGEIPLPRTQEGRKQGPGADVGSGREGKAGGLHSSTDSVLFQAGAHTTHPRK